MTMVNDDDGDDDDGDDDVDNAGDDAGDDAGDEDRDAFSIVSIEIIYFPFCSTKLLRFKMCFHKKL